jgi:hypothetical protein
MLPISLLNQTISISRRQSTGRDSLNNPTYGQPASGSGWSTVYSGLQARLAFSSKPIIFSKEGERVTPTGIVYLNLGPKIYHEDRVLFTNYQGGTVQYVVVDVINAIGINGQPDHIELVVSLP